MHAVATLMTRPVKVIAFGAHHNGIWLTNHRQNGCIIGSKKETHSDLYVWSFKRLSWFSDRTSIIFILTGDKCSQQQKYMGERTRTVIQLNIVRSRHWTNSTTFQLDVQTYSIASTNNYVEICWIIYHLLMIL